MARGPLCFIIRPAGQAPHRRLPLTSNVRPRRTRPSYGHRTEDRISTPPSSWPGSAWYRSCRRPSRSSRHYVRCGGPTSQLGRSTGCVQGKLYASLGTLGLNSSCADGGARQTISKEVRVHVSPAQRSRAMPALRAVAPTLEHRHRFSDHSIRGQASRLALNAVKQQSTVAANSVQRLGTSPARPNPSLKRRANGAALGPRAGSVHHPSRGPSTTPSSPA